MGKPKHRHPEQADLFEVHNAFPVRAPSELLRARDFNRRVAMAMSQAIRECPKSREEIAEAMTLQLAYDEGEVTVAMINAYTATSRDTHTISLVRFIAFVRATGATWLWDVVLHDEGLEILEGEEAYLARAALLQKQADELSSAAAAARAAAPAQIRVRRGSR
ncbi:MAG: hypothetical protein U1C74_32740 [Phenylobacterium sp.]|nr:hypothetical protein [Phenylobacterium sp.]